MCLHLLHQVCGNQAANANLTQKLPLEPGSSLLSWAFQLLGFEVFQVRLKINVFFLISVTI
jgi:hypothetical protein